MQDTHWRGPFHFCKLNPQCKAYMLKYLGQILSPNYVYFTFFFLIYIHTFFFLIQSYGHSEHEHRVVINSKICEHCQDSSGRNISFSSLLTRENKNNNKKKT